MKEFYACLKSDGETVIVKIRLEENTMKKKVVSLVAIGMLALSGCSIGQSTEKQLSETLTKMNDSENGIPRHTK